MRRVYGIGETVCDIIFRSDQPVAAVPGGSVFNGLITLGRLGIHGGFISEIGGDRMGDYVSRFLQENGISSDYLSRYEGTKTAISLAYLDENNDAQYSFYKDYINVRIDFEMPPVQPDDIVMFGSFYAINPVLRPKVLEFLNYAKAHGAILYYDLNFRQNHAAEKEKFMETIHENFRMADIVRGSIDDFRVLYGMTDPDAVYNERVKDYCQRFICTCGSNGVRLYDNGLERSYQSERITPVSTVGAGDNFNAGIVFGLMKYDLKREEISSLTAEQWDALVRCGIDLGTEACRNIANYVSPEFAEKYLSAE